MVLFLLSTHILVVTRLFIRIRHRESFSPVNSYHRCFSTRDGRSGSEEGQGSTHIIVVTRRKQSLQSLI
ncbi:MAG: hypothetical protein QMD80_09610, partial [archaeon]|nr:hypothetical protein [archaeon]